MRILQILAGALIVLGLGASAVTAQTAIPEYRYVYTPDTDFYGADLGQLFDTTQAACARACDAQSSCIGFTYNTRSNACFPKSAVTRSEYFEGAQSARKLNSSPAALDLAALRKPDLAFLSASDFEQARALVQINADRFPDTGFSLEDTVAAMQAAVSRGDTPAAARLNGSAVALTDRGDLWAEMAWLG